MTIRTRFAAASLALALAAPFAPACAKTHANVTPDMPGLDVPPPPPRIVEPTEAETPPPVPLVKEPARHAPPQPPRQNRPAVEAARPEPKPEAPKPEAPVVEPPKPEEPPKPSAPTPLQTTPAQAEGEMERSIRSVLTRAAGDLGHVDYRQLNADARTQYDSAKRFIQQAEDALRAKNLVFARNLADKAGAIAAQLAGR